MVNPQEIVPDENCPKSKKVKSEEVAIQTDLKDLNRWVLKERNGRWQWSRFQWRPRVQKMIMMIDCCNQSHSSERNQCRQRGPILMVAVQHSNNASFPDHTLDPEGIRWHLSPVLLHHEEILYLLPQVLIYPEGIVFHLSQVLLYSEKYRCFRF